MSKCSFCSKLRPKVKYMIAGPKLAVNKSFICNECIEFCYNIIVEEESETNIEDVIAKNKITPESINKHLNDYVISQDIAKEILSVAIYKHHQRSENRKINGIEIEKSNIMLLGPSGVGKTYIVKTVAKYLNIPVAITDATSLTEAGYVGDDVESILERLLQKADGDLEKAQNGIIYIDEIDKKVSKVVGGSANRDVSGEGVQQSLLKIVEGTVVKIPAKNHKITGDVIEFDTSGVLFIVGGSFVGIEKTIQRELQGSSSIGFASDPDTGNDAEGLLSLVKPVHLIEYGMIPEFVGRFPILAPMNSLDENSLIQILTEPRNNLLEQFRLMFDLDNIKLEFSDEFIQYVAEECMIQKIGARGLRTILEKSLLKVQYILPTLSENGVSGITVNRNGDIDYQKTQTEIRSKCSGS